MSCVIEGALTNVVLPDMHPLAAYRLRNVYPVVDEERHFVPLGDAMQLAGRCHQDPGVAGLVPVLEACNAAFERCFNNLTYIFAAEDGGCRVRHQVERVVGRFFSHFGCVVSHRI